MNETQDKLLQQLEQATATGTHRDPLMDDETAELRESWLYLTELLQQQDAQRTETDVVHPVALPPRRRAWTTVAGRALAASLLVAILAAWQAAGRTSSHRPLPAFPKESALATSPSPPLPDELAWSDDLDEQLEAAGQALISIRSGWRQDDLVFSLLQDRLDRMEEEVSADAL